MEGLIEKLKRELEIRNFSKNTVKGYVYSVDIFLDFSKNQGLNESSVKNYIQKSLSRKNPSSVRKDLFAIKFFFEKVLNQKLNLPNPKKNSTLPNILTVEEIRKMIAVTNNIKHRLVIKLLYGCGLRVSEIVNLKNEDLNFEENLIHVKLAKGKKDRFVKIPDSIKEELKNRNITFSEHKEISEIIEKKTLGEMVGMIGHIAIFYRQNADPEKRNIVLPKK